MSNIFYRTCFTFVCITLLSSLSQASWARPTVDFPIVKLRSLDKITARTQVFEAKVGSTIKFGSVYIKVQACRKASELEEPESSAFLQIWEIPSDQANEEKKSEWIFSGWMFGSSPGLSAMDHPIYDVWVLDCLLAKDGKGAVSAVAEDAILEDDSNDEDDVVKDDVEAQND